MNIDYSSILKIDRVQRDGGGGSMLTESENDRSNILFCPAFQRLQQQAQVFPLHASGSARSKLSHALAVAQVGRSIANRIATLLEDANLATRADGEALTNITETACLARDIGDPPFGRAGEAAIQRWFAERGPAKIKAACRTYGGRALDASDPRLVNALADFHEFDSNPQGLRVLAKFQWNNDPRGLNLTKASIASFMQYLRMAGVTTGETPGKLVDKPGFFSTEAGLVKNVWSTFAYDTDPQRFPLSYVVEAAADIASSLGDLEEAIELDLVHQDKAIDFIRNDWLSTYIPIDPDPADEHILEALNAAAGGKTEAVTRFGYADLRRALIVALSGYAARCYVAQHEAVFAGTIDSLLPTQSGSGSMVATLKRYCRQHVHGLQLAQYNDLTGYSVVFGLLEQFGALLECSSERFNSILESAAAQETAHHSLYIEKKLLALIPAEHRSRYAHLVAQLGQVHGRDEEFEEWNARAHLLVDYIASMTESVAIATFRTLSGIRT